MNNVTKVSRILLVLLTIVTIGVIAGCDDSGSDKSSRSLSGFLMDIVSGEKITDGAFTVKMDTTYKTYTGKYDKKTGRYTVSGLPAKAFSYTVIVEDVNAGYGTFTSTNTFVAYDDAGTGIKIDVDMMKNIPLTPVTLQSQEMKIKVVDVNTGSGISGGNYKLLQNSATIDPMQQTTENGDTDVEELFLVQDAIPVQGTYTGGEISIAAGVLLYGYNYTLQIWGATGYLVYDSSASGLTINPYSYNASTGYTVGLTPISKYAYPKIIGISNYNGSNFIASTARTIVITFDQNIELNGVNLQGVGATTLISRVTSDTNGNGITTATVDAEVVVSPALSTRVTFSVATNQLTITLAADTTLITGTIDTGDDLYYTFANLNLVQVKSTLGDASYGLDTLSNCLTTFKGSNTLLFVVR